MIKRARIGWLLLAGTASLYATLATARPPEWTWSRADNGLRLRVDCLSDTIKEGEDLLLVLQFRIDASSRPDSVRTVNRDPAVVEWRLLCTRDEDGARFIDTWGGPGGYGPATDPCCSSTCLEELERVTSDTLQLQTIMDSGLVLPPGHYRAEVTYANSGRVPSEGDRRRTGDHPGTWSGVLAAPAFRVTVQAAAQRTTRIAFSQSICLVQYGNDWLWVWSPTDTVTVGLPYRPYREYWRATRAFLVGPRGDSASVTNSYGGLTMDKYHPLSPESVESLRTGGQLVVQVEVHEQLQTPVGEDRIIWSKTMLARADQASFCHMDSVGHVTR